MTRLNGFALAALASIAGAAPVHASAAPHAATEIAVFSGGCFWGVQAVFAHVKGVIRAESGYTGGEATTADYHTVSDGATGHAESVRIEFDPAEVTYAQLLEVFFAVAHDPTQLDRQGPDRGSQYRSAVWYTNPAQQHAAEAAIARMTKLHAYPRPIVTRLGALGRFYPAESYHQDYYFRNPTAAYIVYNDVPKVEALQHRFPALWRDTPVTITAVSAR